MSKKRWTSRDVGMFETSKRPATPQQRMQALGRLKDGEMNNTEGIGKITFTLPYLCDGLNGPNGLMRQHFMGAAKVKKRIAWDLLAQKPAEMKPISSPVRVTYIRYVSHFMDWDNACASFKHIGDALQSAGILADDSPDVIEDFLPRQVKCKMKERRTEIIIEML